MYLMDAAVKMQEIRLDFQSKWRLATCTEELGQIMLWQGEVAWAVQLCAVAETIRAAHGYDTVAGRKHESYERMLTKARRLLGEKAFEIIWADGQTMTLQQVITAKVPLPWLARESQVGTFIPSSSTIEAGRHNKLTTREAEVLCLLANGLSNGQIAAELGLSPYTVNKHTQSIYGKLSVNSRSAATRYAIEHRLL
jgi:DNA-binding CsgD family transcriptional regulator